MKSIQIKLLFFVFAVTIIGLWSTPVNAQNQDQVGVRINFEEYDVIFLTDFIDAKTQRLSSSLSGVSIILTDNRVEGVGDYCAYVKVQVQLRGDPHPEELVSGYTKNFSIRGSLTLTARDFAKDGSGVAILVREYNEDAKLKKRISDLALTTATAPAGVYQVAIKVLPPDATNLGTVYGEDSKTVVIPYASPDEVLVEINDPKDGSYFYNLAPTFSWTTGASQVVVRVYEAGISHRSPQDALTGSNPYLVREVSGITTLTYPQDARRQLQENKAYVLQLEAKVSTNRGERGNYSRPAVFRITDDKVGKILDNSLNALNGDASSTYSGLRSDPTDWIYWSPYGNITLDGRTITDTDLQTILNGLAGQTGSKLKLSVENQ